MPDCIHTHLPFGGFCTLSLLLLLSLWKTARDCLGSPLIDLCKQQPLGSTTCHAVLRFRSDLGAQAAQCFFNVCGGAEEPTIANVNG